MYLRKVRLILTSLHYASNIKHYSTKGNASTLLARYLRLTDLQTKTLIKQHQLDRLKYDNVKEMLRIFDRLGLDRADISKHAKVFRKTPKTLEVQYLVLKELGFKEVTAKHLAKFRGFVHMRIRTLKALNCIPKHLNVPETLIAYLHPKPIEFNPGQFTEDDILSQVHSTVVKQYLVWRLEATMDEVERLFRVNGATMKLRSLRHICENIDLALELGFPLKKLLKFGYVISAYPDYPKTVMKMLPNLAGRNGWRSSMNAHPKLMTMTPTNVLKIYKMLKQAGINDSMITRHMNIFTLAPETVRIRLKEIKSIPEFYALKKSPNLLEIVLHHNRARSRLLFLQQLQLKCASVNVLSNSDNAFKANLREGRDVNTALDLTSTLAHLLKGDRKFIETSLKRHPFYLHIPLIDIEKTVEYLLQKYDTESILNVVPIVLYSRDKLEEAFQKTRSTQTINSLRLSKMEKLNLALYYMEKEHHFTGNGVW